MKIIKTSIFAFLLLIVTGCQLLLSTTTTNSGTTTNSTVATTTEMTTTQVSTITTTTTNLEEREIMSLHFIDVGQGSSTLIQYKDKNILIDAGEEEYGPTVVNYLKSVGVDDLWIVIGTHPDSDHIGGLNHVINEFDFEYVIDSGFVNNTTEYQEYMNSINNQIINNGSEIIYDTNISEQYFYFDENNEDIYLLVLETGDLDYSDPNNHTVVTLLVYNEVKIFLSGDMETDAENFLLDRLHDNELLEDIDSTIYTAAHHGSRSSNSYAILDEITPEYVIVSAGLDNTYDHPHVEVMERYAQYTDNVYITYEVCPLEDLCAITLDTNGTDVFVDEIPTDTLPEIIEANMEFVNFFEESTVGSPITITVKGQPNTLYNIDFYLPSGSLSGSRSFDVKTSDANGLVTWTYSVGSSTNPGFGSVIVKDVSTGSFIKEVYLFNPK
ncbi:MAG: fold metallo-hydrolase [Haloplasmataceae bacterium]|jgi:beta-lactamase superfamily II metal-dependent hydrolase|nr:fold metallo-hydrolase [Haloplasmataceae bacterium]